MLRRPLGLSQAALARPSHCGHTLWAYIEVITHNVEVVGTKLYFFAFFQFLPKKYIFRSTDIPLGNALPICNTGVTKNPPNLIPDNGSKPFS